LFTTMVNHLTNGCSCYCRFSGYCVLPCLSSSHPWGTM
jgi:hypothetical protein